MTAPSPCSLAQSISASTLSISPVIGTSATPQRRSGLAATSSASQRLCAFDPARPSSGSRSPDNPRPAPNGTAVLLSTASASGYTTSAATPSASSVASLRTASQLPTSSSSCSSNQSLANFEFVTPSFVIASRMDCCSARKLSSSGQYFFSRYGRYCSVGRPAWLSAAMTT